MLQKLELASCPYCGVNKPNLNLRYTTDTHNYLGGSPRDWGLFVCANCGGLVMASGPKGLSSFDRILPEPARVEEEIPTVARQYLQQAIDSRHAPAGAVMLAASAVDAMLKAKGIVDGPLNSRIAQAAKNHIITQEMAHWAHEIRLEANDQRHADQAGALPSQADAEHCIEFANALGTFMFVLPDRVKRGLRDAKSDKS